MHLNPNIRIHANDPSPQLREPDISYSMFWNAGLMLWIFFFVQLNLNYALATTFIFDSRTDVLEKVSKILRQKLPRPKGTRNVGFILDALPFELPGLDSDVGKCISIYSFVWIILLCYQYGVGLRMSGCFSIAVMSAVCVCACVRACLPARVCVSACVYTNFSSSSIFMTHSIQISTSTGQPYLEFVVSACITEPTTYCFDSQPRYQTLFSNQERHGRNTISTR